jgi:chaperone modulatory protein CbpM
MTDQFTESEVVAIVTRLTQSRLVGFIEGAFVRPQRVAHGYVFRQIDIARLELLCDLSLDLDLDETALSIVLSLLDQLHAARQDLAVVARAMETLPADLQAGIAAQMKQP